MFDNKSNMFRLLISGLDKATQQTLSIMYAREKALEFANQQREREKLVKDVADEVLSRISATVDVTDILDEIEEIQKALDKLGK